MKKPRRAISSCQFIQYMENFQTQIDTVYQHEALLLQENGKLLEAIESAKSRIELLESDLHTSNAEVDFKTAEISDLTNRLFLADKCTTDLQRNLAELNAKYSDLTEEHEGLQGKYQAQVEMYDNSAGKNQLLEMDLAGTEQKLTSLQTVFAEMNSLLQSEQSENSALKDDLEIERQKLVTVEVKLSDLQRLFEEMSVLLNDEQEESAVLREDLSYEQQKLSEMESELIQILETSKSRAARICKLDTALETEKSETVVKIETLRVEIADVQKTLRHEREDRSKVEEELRSRVADLQKDLNVSLLQGEEYQQEISRMKLEIEANKTSDCNIEEANKRIAELETERSAALKPDDFEPYLQKLVSAIDLPSALQMRHIEMLVEYRKLTEEYNAEARDFRRGQQKWSQFSTADVLLDQILNLGVLEMMIFETQRSASSVGYSYKIFNVRALKRSMATDLLEEYLDHT